LRNIGYLRFGSKIRQGFAGGITSLTPPLSLSPIWISWAGNEGRGSAFKFGGSLPPPCGAGGLLAAPPPGGRWLPPGRGRQAPARASAQKKIIFIYM